MDELSEKIQENTAAIAALTEAIASLTKEIGGLVADIGVRVDALELLAAAAAPVVAS